MSNPNMNTNQTVTGAYRVAWCNRESVEGNERCAIHAEVHVAYPKQMPRRMTVAEELEVSMRSSLRDIRNQCRFVIANSTNRELVAFAQLICDKTA